MKKTISFVLNSVLAKNRSRNIQNDKIRDYLKDYFYPTGKKVLSADQSNKIIYDIILSGKPFMIGRFGANELSATRIFDFGVKKKYKIVLDYLCTGAGFFPNEISSGEAFKDLILKSIPLVDMMGIWMRPFEDYYLKKYGKKQLQVTYLLDLEPWSSPENPWSAALEGKKVLVIHPFVETIKKQYQNRQNIFPGTDILPEFELKTLKAVQTIAGEKDERFSTWFDALEWMYEEAMKIDFDVAIIGCGAYGFPLAAKIKQNGKQAIHLAGATQLLFGIKGKRWEFNEAFTYVQKFFNDAWVYPDEEDTPKQAKKVEDGCYW